MTEGRSDSRESIELPAEMISALSHSGEDPMADVHMGAVLVQDDHPIGLNTPQLKIIEQPKSRGFRFRYGCEGPSHGGLPGEHSQKGKKSYPSVEIINYKGDARIVVSLVTDEEIPKPHAHSLVGKHCCNGICTVQVGPKDLTACFQNLGIQHVTRKEVIPVLKKRILEHQKVQFALLGTTTMNQIAEDEAEKRAKNMAKDMDLSKVKLCFQAYLKDHEGRFTQSLQPVLSNVVYDSKAPNATTLKICRMDKSSGSANGTEEVYLLCDKVQKDDIEVRFFEVNSKGELTWERSADFGPTDVHRQYAIVFKTPAYRDGNIERPVSVQVQLRRKSDSEVSDPKPFTFHPPIQDKEGILNKRNKPLPNFDQGSGPGSDGSGGRGFPIRGFNFQGLPQQGFGGGNGAFLGLNMQRNPGGPHMQRGEQAPRDSPAPTQGPRGFGMERNPDGPRMQQGERAPQGSSALMQGPRGFQHPIVAHPEVAQLAGGPSTSQQQMFGRHQQQQFQQQHMQQQQLNQPLRQPQAALFQYEQHNGMNGSLMDDDDLQARGFYSSSAQIKQEPNDSDDSCGSVELDDPTELNSKFGIGGSIAADGAGKRREDEWNLGLDFGTDIQSDACAVQSDHCAVQADPCVVTSGYVSDDEIDMIRKHDRRRRGLEPDVIGDSTYKNSAQTDPAKIDYEAKVWEMADLFSRCLQDFGRTGDNRVILQAHNHLCAASDENGDNPIHLAVIHKQPEALHALLSVINNIEDQQIVNQKNKLNQTPLHLAVITEQPDMVTMLMRSGADPNILDNNGYNALHHAVDYALRAVIPTLIDGPPGVSPVPVIKAHPDAKNLDGYSALHMAVEKKDTPAARALIKSGANKDIQDGKSGRAPLHYAVMSEDYTMLSFLVADAKANIEAEDFVGNMPLHLASAHDLSAVAALLIAAGANPETRNQESSGESDVDEGCEISDDDGDYGRSGSSALDFAQSDKMRKILCGETYAPRMSMRSESSQLSAMSTTISTEDSGPFLSERVKTLQIDNQKKQEGDISRLPREYMRSVIRRLDISHPLANDWRAVADHLGMGKMINHLRMFKSPTQVLMDQYAMMDGTLAELHQVMESLGRKDVINILNEAFSHMTIDSKNPPLDNEVHQIAV